MTGIDEQIAEAKGYRQDGPILWLVPGVGLTNEADLNWSEDDAKALELVDEVLAMGPGWSFDLESGRLDVEHLLETNGKEARRPETWRAYVHHGLAVLCGDGATRPEAICRAWLAAKAWMKGRG